MTRDEFLELDAPDAAEALNALLAEGKSPEEAMADCGVEKSDLMKAQIFLVKGKYIARAWGGYTSTKATGNEGAGELGLGGSFKDIKPANQL